MGDVEMNHERRSLRNGLANYTFGSSRDKKQERKDYRSRFTCVPNLSPDNGGPPYFSILIFGLCLAFYFVYNMSDNPDAALIKSIWIYQGVPGAWMKPWTFFTYSFLHADLTHLVSNMIIFLLVTPMLELGHDSVRPAAVYVIGVVMGSLLSGIVAPNVYLVGASGGCYALVLAHIANIIVNGDIMDKKTLVLRLVILAPMVGAALWDAYLAAVRWSSPALGGGGVSYAAHVAGAFTGLFLGTFVLRNYENQKWEKPVKITFVVVYCVAFAAVLVLNAMGVQKGA